MPFCNSTTMALHLAEISQAVAQGAHAVLLMDQAGWHSSAKLDVPDNITIVLFPSRSPELNPVWQFMRDNWLSNRVFKGHDDIVDACCEEQARRSTLDDHVHRHARLGPSVMIIATWYKILVD